MAGKEERSEQAIRTQGVNERRVHVHYKFR